MTILAGSRPVRNPAGRLNPHVDAVSSNFQYIVGCKQCIAYQSIIDTDRIGPEQIDNP